MVIHPIIYFESEDIHKYVKKYKIKFADFYYEPYNFERNECFCCGFGCHGAEENNFIKLKRMNPPLCKAVTNDWGYGKICKRCGVDIE